MKRIRKLIALLTILTLMFSFMSITTSAEMIPEGSATSVETETEEDTEEEATKVTTDASLVLVITDAAITIELDGHQPTFIAERFAIATHFGITPGKVRLLEKLFVILEEGTGTSPEEVVTLREMVFSPVKVLMKEIKDKKKAAKLGVTKEADADEVLESEVEIDLEDEEDEEVKIKKAKEVKEVKETPVIKVAPKNETKPIKDKKTIQDKSNKKAPSEESKSSSKESKGKSKKK